MHKFEQNMLPDSMYMPVTLRRIFWQIPYSILYHTLLNTVNIAYPALVQNISLAFFSMTCGCKEAFFFFVFALLSQPHFFIYLIILWQKKCVNFIHLPLWVFTKIKSGSQQIQIDWYVLQNRSHSLWQHEQ